MIWALIIRISPLDLVVSARGRAFHGERNVLGIVA